MKIIIPMAGQSKRFRDAGYEIPKPFLPVNGRPMIQHVCDMFGETDEFYFICDRKHLDVPAYRDILNKIPRKHHVLGITPPPEGPVATVLHLRNAIPADEAVIVSYCDFSVRWDYRYFKQQIGEYEGAIPCFRGFHPASFGDTYYAYCRVNADNELLELREKKSFTAKRHEEFASAGIYYFDRWDSFTRHAEKALKDFKSVLPECYVSLLYNHMLAEKKKVLVTEVEKFICWGTPKDMEQFVFWSDYFANHANRVMGYA